MTRTSTLGAGLLVLGALLAASASTAGAGGPGWPWAGSFVRTGSTTSSSAPGSAGVVSSSSVVGSSTAGGASGAVGIVSCSGDTCSVMLGGDATVEVLGARISILRIAGDQATLQVDGQEVSCSPGRTASAGAVRLVCTEVTAGTVSVTVTPR